MTLLELQVAEDLLDDALAVVEGAANRQVVDVRVGHRGHLQFLHRGDLAVRMEDEDVDAALAAHPVDRRAAGVTGGGAEDVHVAAALAEQVFKEVAEQLQGHVLEGQGRAVEELEDVDVALLDHRGDLRVSEAGIGTVDQPLEVGRGDVVDEARDDLEGQFRVGQAAQCGEVAGGQTGNLFRQEQAAVFGQPHHHRLLEGNAADLAAGTEIAHKVVP
jgi:hypothetical protein